MKFVCVLLSLCLCCSMLTFAMAPAMPSGNPIEAGEEFPGNRPPIEENVPPNENADGFSERKRFPAMGEGDFQPPQGENPPDFAGGRNLWENREDLVQKDALTLFLEEYSIVPVSLGVLLVAFLFVGLYRRRHY